MIMIYNHNFVYARKTNSYLHSYSYSYTEIFDPSLSLQRMPVQTNSILERTKETHYFVEIGHIKINLTILNGSK